jgi:hypothetical protein
LGFGSCLIHIRIGIEFDLEFALVRTPGFVGSFRAAHLLLDGGDLRQGQNFAADALSQC